VRKLHTDVCRDAIIAAALVAASPVHAEQHAIIRPEWGHVPVNDARDLQPDGVRFAAGQVSGGPYLVMVVYGDEQSGLDATLQTASEAITQGYPVRGVILGPADSLRGERNSVEFWADAQLTATVLNANPGGVPEMLEEIKRGYGILVSRGLVTGRVAVGK